MSCFPIAEEAWGPLDPFTFEGKAQLVVEMQNAQFAKFSMGICDFWDLDSETLGKLFELTYGGKWPKEKVNKTGERIFNLQRMFNVMAGFSNKEDILPERFYQEPLKDGPPKDILMPKEDFIKAMGEYYALRGWDEWGRPTVEKLASLDIEDELIEEYQKALSPR
jgi:aldehyde:ferredoxin oxidoreductase